MSLEEKIKQSHPLNPPLKLILQIWYLNSRIQQQQNVFFSQYNIAPVQYNILRIVKGQKKPCTLKTIQERLLDVNNDVSRLVDKLVRNGLLKRETSTTDRRACQISITPKGEKLLKEIINPEALFLPLFKNIRKDQLKKCLQILDTIIDSFT